MRQYLHVLLIGLLSFHYVNIAASVRAGEPSEEDIGPVQILQSESDALHDIFGEYDGARCDTIWVTDSLRARLEDTLKRGIADSFYVVYDLLRDSTPLGRAIVTEEKGKYRPITFMVGIDGDHRVVNVRVLVYRENRGGEVRRSRFLHQYQGKTSDDPIRINRDIINITGATVSVRALNAGVRKCLAIASIVPAAGGTR